MNQQHLQAALAAPDLASLRQLQGDLLVAGLAPNSPPLTILSQFYHFLNQLAAKATARQYSHFASLLDVGAVGGVALQNLVDGGQRQDWWKRLLAGAISESLMVMAARQYVKSWEKEMQASYYGAGWYLQGELWNLSVATQPELADKERRQLIDRLLAPIYDEQSAGIVKAALLSRLFQFVLFNQLLLTFQPQER